MASYVKIRIRRDTTANWASIDPVLTLGEPGVDLDLHRMKVGNGTSKWSELPFCDEDIIDNYTSNRTDAAASAHIAKVIWDKVLEVDKKASGGGTVILDSYESDRTDAAASAHIAKIIWNKIQDVAKAIASGGTAIIDNLTSTRTDAALSANQGRILDSKVKGVTDQISNFGTFGMGYEVTNYNAYSKPTRIVFEDGVSATLAWSGTQLQTITGSNGEKIQINYNENGTVKGRTVTRS